jgi:ATP-binding cassette subfamily G (WHITE) protein 2
MSPPHALVEPLLGGGGDAALGLAFHDVRLSVRGGREILRGCSGVVPGGKMTALFGATGAGKSTLLDVLAARRGSVRGRVVLFEQGAAAAFDVRAGSLNAVAGYVVQNDLLIESLTLRENVAFSADLRLCRARFGDAARATLVERVIRELGLEGCAETLVGTALCRGLSGGERKRTMVACELVTQPRVLLLDEPTSGLDAAASHAIAELLQALSRAGTTVLMSIHQPRYSIFRLLDHVILLSQGHIVYCGPRERVVAYFGANGFSIEEHDNPADFCLDVLSGLHNIKAEAAGTDGRRGADGGGAGSGDGGSVDDDSSGGDGAAVQLELASNGAVMRAHVALFDAWTRRAEGAAVAAEVAAALVAADASQDHLHPELLRQRGQRLRPGFGTQFRLVAAKTLLGLRRDKMVVYGQLVVMVFFGAITGGIYFQLDLSQTGLQNRLGAFFMLIMSMVFSNLNGIELFLRDRALFIHQRRGRYFDTAPYFCAIVVCDLLPLRIVPLVTYCAIVYPMMGFQASWSHFAWFTATMVVEAICSGSLCYLFSSAIGVFALANLAVSVVYVVAMIFGGLLVNLASLPAWVRWIQYLSFFKYGYEALAVTEMHGLTFEPGISGDAILLMRGLRLDMRSTDLLAMLALACAFLALSLFALHRISSV